MRGFSELRMPHFCAGAGLCLAFLFQACGQPTYRLEGRVPQAVGQVVLLDSLAAVALDSIRHAHAQKLADLATRRAAALDSLAGSASTLGAPIAKARRQYQNAQAAYRQAFLQVKRYRSFGGNPVLTKDDIGVRAEKLLAEIANRFYKGRAFSLETESKLRQYIRQTLVPLEHKVAQARSQVNRLRRSQTDLTQAKRDAAVRFDEERKALFDESNRAILAMLTERAFSQTSVDSSGWYAFPHLSPRRLFVHAPHGLPQGFLVEVHLKAHTRQDLGSDNIQRLLVEDDAGDGA